MRSPVQIWLSAPEVSHAISELIPVVWLFCFYDKNEKCALFVRHERKKL
jgi:hypothetical protein